MRFSDAYYWIYVNICFWLIFCDEDIWPKAWDEHFQCLSEAVVILFVGKIQKDKFKYQPFSLFHYRMDQEFYRRHSMSEAKDENSSSKTLSAAARRSFFRRKHKHKRSGSKDGKDLLALDTISTDSIPFLDGKYLC